MSATSVEILKGDMLICLNAEGAHGQGKVGNPALGDCVSFYFQAMQTSVRTV